MYKCEFMQKWIASLIHQSEAEWFSVAAAVFHGYQQQFMVWERILKCVCVCVRVFSKCINLHSHKFISTWNTNICWCRNTHWKECFLKEIPSHFLFKDRAVLLFGIATNCVVHQIILCIWMSFVVCVLRRRTKMLHLLELSIILCLLSHAVICVCLWIAWVFCFIINDNRDTFW